MRDSAVFTLSVPMISYWSKDPPGTLCTTFSETPPAGSVTGASSRRP
jgi:hypothetical protein